MAMTPREPIGLTLYQAEQYLLELLDTDGAVEADAREAFEEELALALTESAVRREAVAGFILEMEAREKFCREEAARIQHKARIFEGAAKSVRRYVLDWILGHPKEDGSFPRMTGRTLTMSQRKNPPALEITDAAAIPEQFLSVSIRITLPEWRRITRLLDAHVRPVIAVDHNAVRESLKGDGKVPGAHLTQGYSLQVR